MNVMLIVDGDRRWAGQRGLSVRQGYERMARQLAFCCDRFSRHRVKSLYVATSSVTNLLRPRQQVEAFLDNFLAVPGLSGQKIKVTVAGNLELLPAPYRESFLKLQEDTGLNNQFTLHYLVGWSLDDEVVRIYNRLRDTHERIDKAVLARAADIQQPIDLIIRTGQVNRLSSFMPLNSPRAELYFADVLFPDFSEQHIEAALAFYNLQKSKTRFTAEPTGA
ncbi:undecaprenyl diphosphate synthase family protein [Candidatus Parcubacteria bacterium]|nr:undecaprenyl diphosphate synthase family protein [Candidatus Parcubacteria bacterium]